MIKSGDLFRICIFFASLFLVLNADAVTMVKNCNERLKWWVVAVATKVKSTHLLCWEKKNQNICFKCNFFPYICVLCFFLISVVLFYFKQSYAYSWLTIYQSYPYTYVNATRPINNYKSSVKKILNTKKFTTK